MPCPIAKELAEKGWVCPSGFEPKTANPNAPMTWRDHQRLSGADKMRSTFELAKKLGFGTGLVPPYCFFCNQEIPNT